MSNSLSMRVLVVSITICMGLYDIAKYYFSKAKSLFLKNFFKCPKHNDHDARMDCSICQRVRDVPHRNFRSEECPICFSTMKNRVFFNCNHSCCGKKILVESRSGTWCWCWLPICWSLRCVLRWVLGEKWLEVITLL